jgi:hypothetical protein
MSFRAKGRMSLKDHFIQILQYGGLQVDFDSEVSFGLITVFKIRFHMEMWLSGFS